MKDLLSICLLALGFASFNASAQSDFHVTWGVSGFSDDLGITGMKYDLDIGTEYISAHGVIDFNNGLSQPSTGSCFVTSAEGIFCNMTANAGNVILDLGANLSGVIQFVGPTGFVEEAGVATVGDIL